MGFGDDYRYFSYNSLTVPLDIGTWECMLLLRCEYDQQTASRRWARERDRRSSSAKPAICELWWGHRAISAFVRERRRLVCRDCPIVLAAGQRRSYAG